MLPRPILFVLLSLFCIAPVEAAPKFGTRVIDGHCELLEVDGKSDFPKSGYPLSARKERGEAIVLLRVFFSVDGRAEKAVVANFHGHALLAEVARAYAQSQWRIPPQVQGGKAVPCFYETNVTFVLSEGSKLAPHVARLHAEPRKSREAELAATGALIRELNLSARQK